LRVLAETAGLVNVDVRRHRPAFRVSMIAGTQAISSVPR
jgi:hypothetical protein